MNFILYVSLALSTPECLEYYKKLCEALPDKTIQQGQNKHACFVGAVYICTGERPKRKIISI